MTSGDNPRPELIDRQTDIQVDVIDPAGGNCYHSYIPSYDVNIEAIPVSLTVQGLQNEVTQSRSPSTYGQHMVCCAVYYHLRRYCWMVGRARQWWFALALHGPWIPVDVVSLNSSLVALQSEHIIMTYSSNTNQWWCSISRFWGTIMYVSYFQFNSDMQMLLID